MTEHTRSELVSHTIKDGDKMTMIFEDTIISCVVIGMRPRMANGEQLDTRDEANANVDNAEADILPPCAIDPGVVIEAVTTNKLRR